MSCEFITFHADFAPDDAVHPNTALAADSYHRMIDQFFRSARLFHRGAPLSLLTTSDTRVPLRIHGARRFEIAAGTGTAMLDRAAGQLRLARASSFRLPLVFADSDMLINAPLTDLFKQDFDVALTYRRNEDMPINGGLIILNTLRPAVALDFLDRFVAVYRDKYTHSAKWFGDQSALAEIVGLSHRAMAALGEAPIIVCHGCRVLLLSCDVYNYSPKNAFAAIARPLGHVKVVHFKGPRKRLMDYYWAAYLQLWARPGLGTFYSAVEARIAIRRYARQERKRSSGCRRVRW